jgi:hypothetical protein
MEKTVWGDYTNHHIYGHKLCSLDRHLDAIGLYDHRKAQTRRDHVRKQYWRLDGYYADV